MGTVFILALTWRGFDLRFVVVCVFEVSGDIQHFGGHHARAVWLWRIAFWSLISLDDIGGGKRLGKNLLANSGLTSINAESFRRQVRQSA